MGLDPLVTFAGLLVGFVVGLTGMGGGALMTPVLVLLFGVQPLAAVSSDLVASMVMKPVGGGVHFKRGTVDLRLVRWLVIGSVPSAFAGVLLLKRLGDAAGIQDRVRIALGVALLVVSLGLLIRAYIVRKRGVVEAEQPLVVNRWATVAIGVVGGLVVGMTSVGSGSLMMILLLLLYPRIRLTQLVGTDLVQAVPLVASAAAAHLLFGDFQLGLTISILVGALPGVYLGAKLSSQAPDHVIRPVLIAVLSASGLKLLGAPNSAVLVAVAGAALLFAVALRRQRVAAGTVDTTVGARAVDSAVVIPGGADST
jgi:uncharacterized membrane protein YfcA